MKPRIGLVRRIYLVSAALAVFIALAVPILARSFLSPPHEYRLKEARVLASDVFDHRADKELLAHDAESIGTGISISIFDETGKRVASIGDQPPGPVANLNNPPRTDRDMVVRLPLEGPPTHYARVRYTSQLRYQFLAAAVVMGCLMVMSLLLARSLGAPLEQLTEAARKLGEGDLAVRAHIRRRDEFGEVGAAFDEMAERLGTLVRAQRELLANVSHELRTPLARIRVAIDIAAEGDADLARESLSGIAEDLTELERLVEDVLAVARLGGTSPVMRKTRVRIGELLEKSEARFHTMHPGHLLEVVCRDRAVDLDADPVLFRRALDNLLDNAGKYSEKGTTVTLSVVAEDPGRVEITVADRGMGMSKEDVGRAFTPFFRSDSSRTRGTGGVGLGLSLTRSIVLAHDGTIGLESEPGRGTIIRIRVPCIPMASLLEPEPR